MDSTLKHRRNKKESGESLLELIVVIGISVILFFIVADIFISHNRLTQIQSALAEAETNNYLALNRLQKIIKQSDKILANKTINSIAYSASNNTLIMEAPSIDSDGNIIPGVYDYLSVHQGSADLSKLILSVEPASQSSRKSGDTLIASFTDKIIFNYNNTDLDKANLISIYFSNSRTAFGSKQKVEAMTAIGLLNQL